jgi:CheY-like chemotaxis protein
MRVLVIDDEKLMRRMVQRLLSRTHEVVTVESASEALYLLASESFDTILCDVNLAGMNGDELLSRLSPLDAERVVFMTGGDLAHDRGFLAGHALLMKPFSFDTLITALEIGATQSSSARPRRPSLLEMAGSQSSLR